MKKRILAVLLAVTMALGMASVAFAAEGNWVTDRTDPAKFESVTFEGRDAIKLVTNPDSYNDSNNFYNYQG